MATCDVGTDHCVAEVLLHRGREIWFRQTGRCRAGFLYDGFKFFLELDGCFHAI